MNPDKISMRPKLDKLLIVLLLCGAIVACSSPEEKAAEYISNAQALFSEGKTDKAEIEYKNALQINENLPDAWFGLARIHERKQEWRRTYAVLKKILELAPHHVDGRIMLAQMFLATDQIDQALSDAKEILTLAPDNARAHALFAAVQYRLENYPGAQDAVDKALSLDTGNSEALLVRARVLITEKRYDKALDVLDEAIASKPNNYSMYLMKIQAFKDKGDSPAVEQVYHELEKQFPNNLAFKHALANHYLDQQNFDSAEGVLRRIVESNPENVDEKIRLVDFQNRYRSVDEAIALANSYFNASQSEVRYRFMLAGLYEQSAQIDEALKVYRAIVDDKDLNHDGIEARNKIALIKLRAGDNDTAKSLIEEVLQHDKANENALLLQTGFLIAAERFDEAVVNARTVLRDNPDSVKALGLLGQAYDAKGSPELAEETYAKAFQINPGTVVIANRLAKRLIAQRKAEQANDILMQSLSKGNRSLEAIKLLVQVKLALREWDQAEQLAKQLHAVEGQEALSQQMLGVIYQGKERQADSIDAFKKAHELAPAASQPIVALVRTYMRDGKVDAARRFLNSVLSVHNDNVTAYLMLGQIAIYEKQYPQAINQFNKVIEIDPRVDWSYRALASIYLEQGAPDLAERAIERGLVELPDLPILMMNLASVYERQEKFIKAIELYESMLGKNPGLIIAKNNLASLLTDYVAGQDSLERARDISAELKNSQIPQFQDTYAWAAVKSGIDLDEAVGILEGIVEQYNHIDVFNYHLGEAYRVNGDKKNALVYLTKAVELARPGSEIAKKANQSLQQINR